ncbi:hypothetical protein D3C77_752060 [compost metagenome]
MAGQLIAQADVGVEGLLCLAQIIAAVLELLLADLDLAALALGDGFSGYLLAFRQLGQV